MASIVKIPLKSGSVWQVRIVRVGLPKFTLTFSTYAEASEWADKHEEAYMRDPEAYLSINRLDKRRERERHRKKLPSKDTL